MERDTSNWKSTRKIEEEIKKYYNTMFEWYMQRVDDGELLLDEAIAELR